MGVGLITIWSMALFIVIIMRSSVIDSLLVMGIFLEGGVMSSLTNLVLIQFDW